MPDLQIAPDSTRCTTCRYRGTAGIWLCCNYLFIEGQPRPCQPGDRCTVYKRGKRIPCPDEFAAPPKKGEKTMVKIDESNARVMEDLYSQGKNDREIAAVIGSSAQTVANWRNKTGRKPQKLNAADPSPEAVNVEPAKEAPAPRESAPTEEDNRKKLGYELASARSALTEERLENEQLRSCLATADAELASARNEIEKLRQAFLQVCLEKYMEV